MAAHAAPRVLKVLLIAVLWATIWSALVLALAQLPGIAVVLFLVAGIALWPLSDAGVAGLGHPKEGFFIPTDHGLAVALFGFWLLCFASTLAVGLLAVLLSRGSAPHEAPWWQKKERRW